MGCELLTLPPEQTGVFLSDSLVLVPALFLQLSPANLWAQVSVCARYEASVATLARQAKYRPTQSTSCLGLPVPIYTSSVRRERQERKKKTDEQCNGQGFQVPRWYFATFGRLPELPSRAGWVVMVGDFSPNDCRFWEGK